MAKLRNYGPPIYLSSTLTIDLTILVTGTGTYTYDNSVIAYPTIPAGYYSFGDFCILIAQKIRTWIFAITNDAGTLPTPIGSEETIVFTIDWVPSALGTFNGSRVNFTLTDMSCRVGGTKVVITTLTLLSGWPHLLGLGQEDASVVGVNVGPYGSVCSGVFTPRAINTTIRSERRQMRKRISELFNAQPLSDGSIDTYEINGNRGEEQWTIVNNGYPISGDPFHVGICESISAGRLSLYSAFPKVTGRVTGFTGSGLYASYLPVGSYVGVEGAGNSGFVSRVKEHITPGTEGGANRLEVVLQEKIPSTFVLKAKSPLYRVPDAWAARFDSKRLGNHFLLYGSEDNSGAGLWIFEDWALNGDGGNFIETTERRNDTNNQYSLSFTGLRRLVTDMTLVTT